MLRLTVHAEMATGNEALMSRSARSGLEDDAKISNMRGREATIDDLYQVEEGKAEIVGGRLVLMGPIGWLPSFSADEISVSLREYGRRTKRGYAASQNVAFVVNLPNRRSFCPDVAFTTEPPRTGEFIKGAPVFAAEVRSTGDYGRAAERAMAAKRTEYFAAGTLVVWDVDVLKKQVVRVYRASDPLSPTIYRRGEHAEAEPALPGWTMPVDDLFAPE